MRIAVQTYTMRDQMKADFWGTLRKVAALGYAGVELTDVRGIMRAEDLQSRLENMSLCVVGVHVALEQIESELDEVLDYYSEAGIDRLTVPWVPETRRASAHDWMALGGLLSDAGARARERGIILGYHNHDFEMKKYDGVAGIDILLKAADARNLQWEGDTFWIQYGGENPAEYIKRYSDRIALLHIKDMTAGEERKFAPIGTGILDWPAIMAAAKAAGVRWLIVEQDDCYGASPLDVVAESLQNIKKMKW
jgi:sugar phosphate isomerase/epimerase